MVWLSVHCRCSLPLLQRTLQEVMTCNSSEQLHHQQLRPPELPWRNGLTDQPSLRNQREIGEFVLLVHLVPATRVRTWVGEVRSSCLIPLVRPGGVSSLELKGAMFARAKCRRGRLLNPSNPSIQSNIAADSLSLVDHFLVWRRLTNNTASPIIQYNTTDNSSLTCSAVSGTQSWLRP